MTLQGFPERMLVQRMAVTLLEDQIFLEFARLEERLGSHLPELFLRVCGSDEHKDRRDTKVSPVRLAR